MDSQSNKMNFAAGVAKKAGFSALASIVPVYGTIDYSAVSATNVQETAPAISDANSFVLPIEPISHQSNRAQDAGKPKKEISRWSGKLERRFDKLYFKRARGECTQTEDEELDHLITARDRLTQSRTVEEIFHDAQKEKLLAEMGDIFRRYTTFLNERKNNTANSAIIRAQATYVSTSAT